MNKLVRSLAMAALAALLTVSGTTLAAQTTTKTKATKAAKTTKAAPASTSAPSDKDIADAKAKGLVWVNTNTKVYHKDGQFYGKTKQGQFMTEADAVKAGNRAAQEPGGKKSTASTTATKSTSKSTSKKK